jgi:N-acetylneuraminate synthase/pseudaminic acid synthase
MEFKIGKHIIGDSHPTFIVAEMSGNHGGNLETALEIVRAAKRAGADAVKLQTYTADTITINSDKADFRILNGNPWSDYSTLWELYNKAHTPWEWHEKIFAEARRLEIEVFSSPFDSTAVDFLESLGVPAYKIASPEITNIPLLERVAKTGKPVIISTGISELSDLELAIATLKDNGQKDIIILKCTTSYPAPPSESNLLTIPDIISRFGVISGLSDHSMGTAAAIATVALGGRLIEKHFTLDNSEETVDSFFSSGESEFKRMVDDIRFIDQALGKVTYDITPSALPSLRGRSSLYIANTIRAGEIFDSSNVKSVRPSFGLHPKHYKEILGKTAKKDLEIGDRLTWEVIN